MITSFEGKYAFLSNFYAAQVQYMNNIWPTTEHAYQAAKTLDKQEQKKIWEACTPDDAKHLGRRVTIRADWEEVKDQIMYEIVKEKFKNPGLKRKLLNTGNEVLCEGNYWHDNYWGSCTCPKCMKVTPKNKLGKILMKVREELKDKE